MQRWMIRLRPLACGGVTLGVLQAIQGIDLNRMWFEFLLTWLNALISLLLGGDASALGSGGSTSPFGSFFL